MVVGNVNDIIIAMLGSGVLSALIASATTLLVRFMDKKDSKEEKLEDIEKKVKKAEVDNVRLQMMVLMSDFPDDEQEILRVAEHYFKDLKGNWYMTSMFNNWLKNNNIAEPEWFEGGVK